MEYIIATEETSYAYYSVRAENEAEAKKLWEQGEVTEPFRTDNHEAELRFVDTAKHFGGR
jgi:hypothetical protein